MSDRLAIQFGVPLILFVAGIAAMVVAFVFPQTEERIVYRYVNHPAGTHLIPALSERVEVSSELTKDCRVYASFDPITAEGYVLGQRFASFCSIVKTGPKG